MTRAIHLEAVHADLLAKPKRWLITGIAGFIGSNLLETLLQMDQTVVGLDNFATGHAHNLDEVKALVSPERWSRFTFHEGDIRDPRICDIACRDVEIVLHHAALGSVPRSIADPLATNASNIDGFLNMLVAARDHRVSRFIYAASSSTYGDHPGLPKVEQLIGKPLSPYAVTKYVNELYADVFSRTYQMRCVGLRYFNVFGARQDPNGAYAAVIPKWIHSLLKSEAVQINGDGSTSRDFCYVKNVVQANLLSACGELKGPHEVYNVAAGRRTTLLELLDLITQSLSEATGLGTFPLPIMRDFRAGDVRHSLADVSKIQEHFGYEPTHHVLEGLREALPWYVGRTSSKS